MVRRVHTYSDGGPVHQPKWTPKYKAELDAKAAAEKAAEPARAAKAAAGEARMNKALADMRVKNKERATVDRRAAARMRANKAPTRQTTNAAARYASKTARAAGPAVSAAEATAGRVALRAGAVGLAGAAGYAAGKYANDKLKISDKIVDAISPKYDPNAKEK